VRCRRKISIVGLSQEVSSSVPARRIAAPASPSGSARIVEPQFGHSRRTFCLPLSAVAA
jgi:hypothetical protein